MTSTGYCVKCKTKTEIKDGREVVLKNNRKAVKGVCSKCGSSIFRMSGKGSQAGEKVDTAEQRKEGTGVKTRATQRTASQSSKGKKKKHVCIEAGKLAGKVSRGVYPIYQGVSKVGTSAYQGAQTVVKKGEQVVKSTFSLWAGRGRQKGLNQYEKKQHQFFTQLGIEVFQLKKKQTEDIWGQPKVEKIIKELDDMDQHIQKMRNGMEAEQAEKKKQASFNRALTDLKNSDSRKRLTAIQVLEKLGKKEGIVHLSKALADPDEAVRARAATAINKLASLTPITAEKRRKKTKAKKQVPSSLPKKKIGPEPEPEPAPA